MCKSWPVLLSGAKPGQVITFLKLSLYIWWIAHLRLVFCTIQMILLTVVINEWYLYSFKQFSTSGLCRFNASVERDVPYMIVHTCRTKFYFILAKIRAASLKCHFILNPRNNSRKVTYFDIKSYWVCHELFNNKNWNIVKSVVLVLFIIFYSGICWFWTLIYLVK